MTQWARRKLAGFLTSPRLAVGLLVFVGVWSLLATVVAQGGPTSPDVNTWAAKHALMEPIVRAVDLHAAFTSPVLLAAIILLAVSTAGCAWRRTQVACARAHLLREAAQADRQRVLELSDLQIPIGSTLSNQDALSIVSQTLAGLGVRVRRSGDLLVAVSPPWSVWGSSIFHWSLAALIVVVLLGQMMRSEGSLSLAVGQVKADDPASYGSVHAGPWRDWSRTHRSVRLDKFEPDYATGGIDRGAVPTVSLLDGAGRVVKTQRVYQNMMLHVGSLAINAPGAGLAVVLGFLNPSGGMTGRSILLVDFSQTATEGTVPVSAVLSGSSGGNAAMRLSATVPLDRVDGHFGEWIPRQPDARVLVQSSDGTPLLDKVLKTGESVALPGGGAVRLIDVGWYSRLSLVDDPTVPFIYAAMVAAAVGLALTLAVRQQVLVAAVQEGAEGATLVMRLRLWRNVPTNQDEIGSRLVEALRGIEEGSTT